MHILKGTIQILKDDLVLDSEYFTNLKSGVAYKYVCKSLARGREYRVKVQLEIKEIPGKVMVFTSDFYFTHPPRKDLGAEYKSFADSIYRSLEYTTVDNGGKVFELWFTKVLEFKEKDIQPVISMGIHIK